MKKNRVLLLVVFLASFFIFLAPTGMFAAVQTGVNFKFCPTIAAGQLDGYIFSNGSLGIYSGAPSTTNKPKAIADMFGPDTSGTTSTNNCYFGYQGAGDIDTSIRPLILHIEIPVSPPGSKAGDPVVKYLKVEQTVPVLAVLSGDTYTFSGALKTSGVKPISTSLFFANTGGSAGGYRLFTSLVCTDQPLTCFTQAVFKFAQIAIIVLAVGAIVIAGIIYMTSAGNPKQIEMAKKLILGALTGVAVMVLGRLFLTQVVGVAWPWL